MPDAAATRVFLCGRLGLELAGERRETALRGRQGRLLFAYLVLHRHRPVRRDELVEALWPEEEGPSPSESALNPLLSRLRRAVAPGTVQGREQLVLALPEPVWIDWEAAHGGLDGARRALAAGDWRAAADAAQEVCAIAERDLLPGLEAPWLQERRAALADLRVEALEARAQAGVRLGGADMAGAEQAARAAVAAAPFRESARVALVEALRARGNVAEALRAYDEVRVLLREELGTTPGRELVALHESLLAGAEPPAGGVAPWAPPLPSPVPAGAAAPPASPPAGDLVERDRELAALAALLDEAAAGDGRVALLEGAAGLGKTRLLTEARRLAAGRGWRVLSARAGVLEREFPFGVVRQLYEAAVAGADGAQALTGPAAPAAAVFADAAAATDSDAEHATDSSFAVLHGLFWLTLNLAAGRPLLLCVDDLHWADRSSLRFLAYLVRRLEGLPVLVATTLRTGEPATDDALVAEIAQDPVTALVRPAPLTPGAVAALVRGRLGAGADSPFCAACHQATGGNPLLVRQLLTALEAGRVSPDAASAHVVRNIGPRAVSRTVLLRLGRLAPDAVSVARAVAVLGEHAEPLTAAAFTGLDEGAVAAGVAALMRADILRPERPLGFVHPLVRDAVYGDLLPGEREAEHARAAQVLAGRDAPADQVAAHLLQSAPRGDPWVVERLRDAARLATAKGAVESAPAYLQRALEEPPLPRERADVLLELGLAETHSAGPAALEHLLAAREEATEPAVRGQAGYMAARTLLFIGQPERADAVAERTLAELPAHLEDLRMAVQAVELMGIFFGGAPFSKLGQVPALRGGGLGPGPGAKMLTGVASFALAVMSEPVADCERLAAEVYADDAIFSADNGLFWVTANIAFVLGDTTRALAVWERGLAMAHRHGSPFAVLTVDLWRGVTHLLRGELADAAQMVERAYEALRRWGSDEANLYPIAFLAEILMEQGDFAAARAALERGRPADLRSDAARFYRLAEGKLLLAEGDPAGALARADAVAEACGPMTNPGWHRWRSLKSRALLALGRRDAAIATAEAAVPLARRFGTPAVLGGALRALGGVQGGDVGADTLREAVAILRRSTAKLELAKALAALAKAEADTPLLQEALALADECGATGFAARLRARLAETGAAVAGPEARALLSGSERRLLDLADTGLDARAIAERLYLTPNEVEHELAAALAKLAPA